jgi:hypothetical protein
MDDTLTKITELLSRRRAELQQHFEGSAVWENTTAELLDRVQRLKTRLDAVVAPPASSDKQPSS